MSRETGVAWAAETHFTLLKSLRELRPTYGGNEVFDAALDSASRATPMYVAAHVDRMIGVAANSLPLDTLAFIPQIDLPLAIYVDGAKSVVPEERGTWTAFIVDRSASDDGHQWLSATLILGPTQTEAGLSFTWRTREGARVAEFMFHMADGGDMSDKDQELMTCYVTWLWSSLLWMRERVVSVTRETIERHARKRLTKELEAAGSDFHVVSLRRTENPLPRNGPSTVVDWQHQWLVRGHWRRIATDKTTWVRPHVKGPEDKPMLPVRPLVYAGVR